MCHQGIERVHGIDILTFSGYNNAQNHAEGGDYIDILTFGGYNSVQNYAEVRNHEEVA